MNEVIINKTNNVTPKNECPQCKSVYSNYSNLRKHVKKFHPDEETKLAPPRYKTPTNYKFSCTICARNFNHGRHLRHHMKTRHETPCEIPRKPKKCPLCEFQDLTKLDLIRHFEQVHGVIIRKRNIEVANADFQKWKSDLECKTNTRYVREYTRKYKNDATAESYGCHRSGIYVPGGKGLRHLKTQGSTKINAFCPAGLKVRREKLKCHVQLIETHVGHKCDLDHLWLTKSEREALAQKIAAEVPFDQILDEIRGSVSDSASQRIHFLTRKDLHNIKSTLNLPPSSVHHSNDTNENEILNYIDLPSDNEPSESNAVLIETKEVELAPELPKKNHQSPISTLVEEKEAVKKFFNTLVDNAATFSELAIIKRTIASISPAQTDVSSTSQFHKLDEKLPQNKICVQKRLLPTKIKRKVTREKKSTAKVDSNGF